MQPLRRRVPLSPVPSARCLLIAFAAVTIVEAASLHDRPKLRPAGQLKVNSLRVSSGKEDGSRLFLGAPGTGFSIGTDPAENFLVEQAAMPGQPLLMLTKENVMKIGATRVEALSVNSNGGVSVRGVRQWELVHSEDFTQVMGVGWTRNDVTACGGVNMLGGFCKFSRGEVNKTFAGLPPHKQLRVKATYHFIDRWIGEAGYMKLNIGQANSPVVVWSEQHSQQMSKNGVSLCGQAATPEGKFSATIDVTVAHTQAGAVIAFGSTMEDSDPCDESWGVSGIELYTRD